MKSVLIFTFRQLCIAILSRLNEIDLPKNFGCYKIINKNKQLVSKSIRFHY